MKKYLFISMILLAFNANAGLEALSVSYTSENFNTLCLENDQWKNCSQGVDVTPAEYTTLYHNPLTGESTAIGYIDNDDLRTFTVVCRSENYNDWQNCTPDAAVIPLGHYSKDSASDGQGRIMLTGRDDNDNLIAACRNTNGEWWNCSPSSQFMDYQFPSVVNFTNNEWVVLFSTGYAEYPYEIMHALCMNETNTWRSCDMAVYDPNRDTFGDSYDHIEYVSASDEWVAVGHGYLEGYDDLYAKSLCRSSGSSVWYYCASDVYPSNGIQALIQNAQGELLQINLVRSGIFLTVQMLCKNPNSAWTDCSLGLTQNNQIYTSGTLDEAGNWVLVGSHLSNDMSENLAYLTAKFNGNGWDVLSQEPDDPTSSFFDVVLTH